MLKSAALYVIMVGIPVAGLFAILEWGESLEPPAHVGGTWSVAENEAAACSALPAGTLVTIEQSGRFLRVRLPDRPPAKGKLEAGRVQARVSAAAGLCAALDVDVEARLGDDGESLVGTVAAPACAACPSSVFVARREKAKH